MIDADSKHCCTLYSTMPDLSDPSLCMLYYIYTVLVAALLFFPHVYICSIEIIGSIRDTLFDVCVCAWSGQLMTQI